MIICYYGSKNLLSLKPVIACNMKKRIWLALLFSPLLALADEDVALLSSTDQQVVIKFTPIYQGICQSSAPFKSQLFFAALNCSYQTCHSQYLLPVRKLLQHNKPQAKFL